MYLNKILLIIFISLFAVSLTAQRNPYRIQNLSLNVFDNQLHVNYDLIGTRSEAPVNVRLLFYDQQYRIYIPEFVQPGYRDLIKPGINRSITWDFTQEMRKIDVELHPYLIAGDVANHNFGMGAEASLFSILIPGLGNYFVSDTRNQTIKPWMKTISSFGLIALGGIASRDRNRGEASIKDGKLWRMGYWHYKYFKHDAELIIAAGLAIWVADIIWVAMRGNHNTKLKRKVLGMEVVYR